MMQAGLNHLMRNYLHAQYAHLTKKINRTFVLFQLHLILNLALIKDSLIHY